MNKKEILMQPNNLIKSKYDFTSIENKLFYKLLFNAQKQSDNSKLYSTKVTKDELKEFIMNRNDYQSKNIKEILNMFQQSVLEFDYIDDGTGNLITFSSGLITSYQLDHGEQVYTIEIHEILYRHITDFIKMQKIGNGYTPINLSLLFNFRGVYTQRLYTFLRLWSREGKEIEVRYKLDELRNCLKLKSDIYPAYKYFKQNVLKRAIKEINESGNMNVEIKEEIRKNRKVDTIVFSVTDHEPRKYFEDVPSKGMSKEKSECNSKFKEDEIAATTDVKEFQIIDFYVPNKKLFTAKTLSDFINDFSSYDFKESKNKKALQESILAALEKDDEEKIKVKAYNYFKVTLQDQLSKVSSLEDTEGYSKKPSPKFHNFRQTFNKYSPDELEHILLNQQDKHGDISEQLYDSAINGRWETLSIHSKEMVVNYAKDKGLFIPEEWKEQVC